MWGGYNFIRKVGRSMGGVWENGRPKSKSQEERDRTSEASGVNRGGETNGKRR